jgi:hypothetical protein
MYVYQSARIIRSILCVLVSRAGSSPWCRSWNFLQVEAINHNKQTSLCTMKL